MTTLKKITERRAVRREVVDDHKERMLAETRAWPPA